jgi:hypothetical protein
VDFFDGLEAARERWNVLDHPFLPAVVGRRPDPRGAGRLPATAYLDLHAELDVEHAAAERALIEPRMDGADRDTLLAEAERVLRANWELLDGVERLNARAG